MPAPPPDPAPQLRDRRDDGRPEQARPRDRTGRPLPYGTTGVPLAEEHEPASVEQALVLGAQLWDQLRFFEAHECLEQVWHAAAEGDEDLWQGVIQVAVAGVHLQRGNRGGATSLLERAEQRLAAYPDGHRGIEVTATRRSLAALIARLRAGDEVSDRDLPGFPAGPGGAWYAATPQATGPSADPTPLPDEPAWLAAGRPRAPSQRPGGERR